MKTHTLEGLVCVLSLRERHVSSQFDDFSQRIHLAFTNVHLLIASRSPCSLCHLAPLLATTPLAAPKLFSPSLTTRNKRNSPATSLTSYSSWLKTSHPSLTLALLTTTLALPITTPSVTMRSLIPNFLPASSSSSPGGPTIYLGAYRTWRALFFGSTFPATRRV